MSEPFYITTAIDYPNGAPHIGHAYEKIATDAIARFKRLDGFDVRFLTGTDVHGLKMAETAAAQRASRPPSWRGATPTSSSRCRSGSTSRSTGSSGPPTPTTTRRRRRSGSRMNDAGDIYLDSYPGWYSVRDERFFTEDETEVRDDGVRYAIETGTPVTWTEEQTYFFRLSAYTDRLLAHYEANPEFIGPDVRRNEVVSFVSGGPAGPVDLAHHVRLGRAGARPSRPRHVRLGRRA